MANRALRVAIATSIFTVCWSLPSQRLRPAGSGSDSDSGSNSGAGQRSAIKARAAGQGEFPWQAQLLKRGSHVCGAVIVSDRWLLTAAHCLSGLEQLDAYQVVLGEHDVSIDEGTEQRRRVAEVVLYSGRFGRSRGPQASLQSDIALMKLDRPAIFTDAIRPIELPQPEDDFTGSVGTVAGWGASDATVNGPIFPRLLHKVALRVLSDDQCVQQLSFFNFARRTMACAVPPGPSSLCWGDSGGGLAVRRADGRPVLAAVTSWGVDCGLSRTPAVFVDVPYHVNWVRDVISETLFDEMALPLLL